jgi:hypothetical protein
MRVGPRPPCMVGNNKYMVIGRGNPTKKGDDHDGRVDRGRPVPRGRGRTMR